MIVSDVEMGDAVLAFLQGCGVFPIDGLQPMLEVLLRPTATCELLLASFDSLSKYSFASVVSLLFYILSGPTNLYTLVSAGRNHDQPLIGG